MLMKTSALRGERTKNVITGHVAVWGSPAERDAYDTWFDRANPPDMALDFLPLKLMYEHGFDDKIDLIIIGEVVRVWIDDIGIAFEAELYRDKTDVFNRVYDEIARGELKTSSASSEHLARFDDDGRFVKWYLSELTLTKSPAEHRITTVTFVRSKPNGYVAIAATRDALISGISDNFDNTSRKAHNMKYKFRTKDGQPLSPFAAAQAVSARRTVYDQNGQELTAEQAIQMMLADGNITADDLASILAQMGSPDDEMPDERALNEVDAGDQSTDDLQSQLQQIQTALETALNGTRSNNVSPEIRKLQERLNALESAPPDNDDTMIAPTRNQPKKPKATRRQRVQVVDRYSGVSGAGLALGYQILRADGQQPSDMFIKAMTHKIVGALDSGNVDAETEFAIRSQLPENFKANDVFASDMTALRSLANTDAPALRADEVMNPTNVDDGAGSNTTSSWVKDFNGADIWASVREQPNLYNAMRAKGMEEMEIPSGYKGATIPVEGIDFTFYTTAAAEDWDAGSGRATPTGSTSRTSNPEVTMTIAKLSAMAAMAQEIIEDSIVPQLDSAQNKLRIQADEQIEYIMINGHTVATANNNLNLSDGTPASAPTRPSYLMLNGLLYYGIVAQTPLDANNTHDEDTYNELYALYPDEYMDDDRLLFVQDKRSYLTLRNLPSVKTRDVNSQATIETGRVVNMWGVDLMSTSRLKPAHTTGYLTPSTAAQHTQGRILCVRPDQCMFGFKRRPSVELERNAVADATTLVLHMRFGFLVKDNDAVKAAIDVKTIDSAS